MQAEVEEDAELDSQRSKLYCSRDGVWTEFGLGIAKLLESRDTGKVRFVLRQEIPLEMVCTSWTLLPTASRSLYADAREAGAAISFQQGRSATPRGV